MLGEGRLAEDTPRHRGGGGIQSRYVRRREGRAANTILKLSLSHEIDPLPCWPVPVATPMSKDPGCARLTVSYTRPAQSLTIYACRVVLSRGPDQKKRKTSFAGST